MDSATPRGWIRRTMTRVRAKAQPGPEESVPAAQRKFARSLGLAAGIIIYLLVGQTYLILSDSGINKNTAQAATSAAAAARDAKNTAAAVAQQGVDAAARSDANQAFIIAQDDRIIACLTRPTIDQCPALFQSTTVTVTGRPPSFVTVPGATRIVPSPFPVPVPTVLAPGSPAPGGGGSGAGSPTPGNGGGNGGGNNGNGNGNGRPALTLSSIPSLPSGVVPTGLLPGVRLGAAKAASSRRKGC